VDRSFSPPDHAVTGLDLPLPEALSRMKRLGFDGIEVMMAILTLRRGDFPEDRAGPWS